MAKTMNKKKVILIAVAALFTSAAIAGNEDRVGSAGATELLYNPWARSSAWADAGMSSVTGVEAIFMNVAGLAQIKKTELSFVRTNWLAGTGININTIGLGQKVGETGSLGLYFSSLNFGDIMVTTEELPDGSPNVFSPRYVNFGLSYAKEFSNSIYAGITVKGINHSISNVRATGIALDAGIKYITGEKDQIKFGIDIKNVGPPMRMSGDGFSYLSQIVATGAQITMQQRSAKYELPSQVNIGFSYDFLFKETSKLVAAFCFSSNSFSKDQYRFGLDYGYTFKKAAVNIRAGYVYEKGIFSADKRTTGLIGPTFGASVDFLAGEKQHHIGLDYSYRVTNPFAGVHSIGLRIELF